MLGIITPHPHYLFPEVSRNACLPFSLISPLPLPRGTLCRGGVVLITIQPSSHRFAFTLLG